MSKLFKWGLSVLALSVLAACGNSGSSEASKATGLSTGETGTSVPAETSKEESVPAEASKEESLPAEASKEESIPAEASKEESLPAQESEEPVQSSEEVETPVFYVVGSFNGWAQYDENYKMSYAEEEKIYYFEGLNLKEGAELKVMGNVNKELKWYPTANVKITETAKYEIDFDYADGTVTPLKTGEFDGDTEVTYYLTGDFASWGAKDQYKLSFDETLEFYVIEGVELSAGAMVKVVDSDNRWYPDGDGNHYSVVEDGFYTVHFDPQGGHEDWHAGFFSVLHASL